MPDLWLERFFSNCPPSLVQQPIRRERVVFDGYPESRDPVSLPPRLDRKRRPFTTVPSQRQMNERRADRSKRVPGFGRLTAA